MLSGPFCLLLFPGGHPVIFPGGAALTGATWDGSPDKALAPPSGGARWRKYSPAGTVNILPQAALIFPGGATLTGATWEGSPDKAQAPPSGELPGGGNVPPQAALIFPGGATLTGATWDGSPDKALAPPSGRGSGVRRGSAGLAVHCCCSAPVKRPASGPGTERPPGSGNRQPALHEPQSRHR
ncbi:hypothetical protein electrica_04537 [Klebsiella electrica]|nr:hypothetical protein electrica_04537 [Klebsiella electrica]